MAHSWLVILENGACVISQANIEGDDFVLHCVPFDTEQDAIEAREMYVSQIAKSALAGISNRNGVSSDSCTEKETQMKEMQQVHAAALERVLDDSAELQILYFNARDAFYKYQEYVKFLMRELALQTVLEKTHRQRNENLRSLVHAMQNFTSLTIDELVTRDVNDIPF